MPKDIGMLEILIELKAENNCSQQQLKELSQAALRQMTDRQYDADMKSKGIDKILKYGVALHRRHAHGWQSTISRGRAGQR